MLGKIILKVYNGRLCNIKQTVMEFLQSYEWWSLLAGSFATGLIQLIGHYGIGRSSKKIEYTFNFITILIFILSFYRTGVLGGIILTILSVAANSSIAKLLVRKYFISKVGYIPRDREELRIEITNEYISRGQTFSPLDVENEVLKHGKKYK